MSQVYEKEKTVEITAEDAPYAPEEELGTYKLKRWTWYEKQVVMSRATKVIDAKLGMVQAPLPDFNIHSVIMCLVESPFEINEDPMIAFERFKTLDSDVGDILFQAMQSINMFTKEEKTDF